MKFGEQRKWLGTVWKWALLFQQNCTLVHKEKHIKTRMSKFGVEELDLSLAEHLAMVMCFWENS